MEATAVFLALAFAINKTGGLIKSIGKDNNAVFTQLILWAVAFVALLLAANAELTKAYALPGFTQPLGTLDVASVGLLAWMLGATGMFSYDVVTAIAKTRQPEPKLTSVPKSDPAV